MKIYVDKNALQDYTTKLIAKEKTIFATKDEVGSPLVASTVAEMTDHDKIYVYVGSETGYTAGNWYYWDGSAWTSGGIYNSEGFVLDATLTSATLPAQAKAAGDAINLKADQASVDILYSNMRNAGSAAYSTYRATANVGGKYQFVVGYYQGEIGDELSWTSVGTKTAKTLNSYTITKPCRITLGNSSVYKMSVRATDKSNNNTIVFKTPFQSEDIFIDPTPYPQNMFVAVNIQRIDGEAIGDYLDAISDVFGIYYQDQRTLSEDIDTLESNFGILNSNMGIAGSAAYSVYRPFGLSDDGKYTFYAGYWSGDVGDTLDYASGGTLTARDIVVDIIAPCRVSIKNSSVYKMAIRIAYKTSSTIVFKSDYRAEDLYIDPSQYPNDAIKIGVNVQRADGTAITNDLTAIADIFGIYYQDQYVFSDKYYAQNTAKMMLEHGRLSNPSRLLYDASGLYTDFYTTMRTPHFLDLQKCKSYSVTSDYVVTAVYYDSSYTFASEETLSSGVSVNVPGGIRYARFVCKKSDDSNIGIEHDVLNILCLGEPKILKAIDNRGYSDDNIKMCYIVPGQIGRDYSAATAQTRGLVDTTGILILPPNYSNTGNPVPLIVYAHGSSDYYSKWQNKIRGVVGNPEVIQYLVDEGYAVFDCFGHSSDAQITDGKAHTYGSIDCMNCYVAGIRRVFDVYNIKTDGVYVTGISSGGLTALNLAFGNDIPVLACAPLAPAISMFNRYLGYSEEQRLEYVWAMGFEGNTDCLAGKDGASSTTEESPENTQTLFDYFTANASKTIGYNPMWNGVIGTPLSTLLTWALTPYGSNRLGGGDRLSSNWINVYRTCKTPIKIWIAEDDHNVPPSIIDNFLTTLKNGNSIAEKRTVPDGQGGHYAFSSSETTTRASGVTALGIAYTDIPIYWLEMVAFFKRY